MEIIKSLAGLSSDELYAAFSEAFKDYEMQLDKDGLMEMLKRRGFEKELSFGAFVDGRLVSFTFNGIDQWNGIKTAYDTGTGTVEEFRGKGLATKVFNLSIPYLKEAGVEQYLLEVLQHNDKAVSVYRKIGFNVTREFNYFSQSMDEIKIKPVELSPNYQIKVIDLNDKVLLASFWDFEPSWQNSFSSIDRNIDNFKSFGVFYYGEMIGYAVCEPDSGDITQLAVNKDHRNKGIATVLLQKMFSVNQANSMKMINTELGCYAITKFIKSH